MRNASIMICVAQVSTRNIVVPSAVTVSGVVPSWERSSTRYSAKSLGFVGG
ncbi:MAG TPA: hypothetical protein VH008_03230 [Pseudonocardia sp.]|nr:hypothetical protein [Pseudonocardia sp.]